MPPFFIAACARSIIARARFDIQSDGVRLVHGESDGLPGLIVDRYGDTLVAQFTSAGTERWKAVIADALLRETGLTRLYERSDASVRALEGLEPATGWLRGGAAPGGVAPPVELTIHEHQWQLTLNIAEGHKTGFYLDQRDSRKRFADYARRLGFQHVLNCFCYTGGFSVAALAGMRAAEAAGGAPGGQVISIDSSGPALELCACACGAQRFRPGPCQFPGRRRERVAAPVSEGRAAVRRHRARSAEVCPHGGRMPTVPHARTRTSTGWRCNCLRPAACCSRSLARAVSAPICSTRSWPRPARMPAWTATSLSRLGGAPDHPMTLEFPEGEYLKGLIVMRKG